jgi:hypothetical protein
MNLPTLYLDLVAALSGGAIALHLTSFLSGKIKTSLSEILCHPPILDLIIAFFTLIPNILGLILAGWPGFFVAIAAQASVLVLWMIAHELAHYKLWKGPKISRTMGRLVGNWQNHVALWVTLPAISAFWMVRLYELLLYPILTWTVHFPKYNAKDWINISRHKFDGLVGFDLIWCLYCDWMTGVWSLGTEMLRNVESFWCPIRFYSEKKCENCKIDFPDLDQGWVSADSNIEAATQRLTEKYSNQKLKAWYGHSARAANANLDLDSEIGSDGSTVPDLPPPEQNS